MKRLYGRVDSEPGGGTTPSPSFTRNSKLRSTCDTSQPASKIAKAFALSGMFIFSAPIASAMSHAPERMYCAARCRAELPDAQAFSTLKTGTPSMPILLNMTCPGMAIWPCRLPLVMPE